MNTYKLLAQEIILCALKDYKKAKKKGNEKECEGVKLWVDQNNPTLNFCATAYSVNTQQVQSYVLNGITSIESANNI